MNHSHPPHLPPGFVMRRGHTWPGARLDPLPRRKWTPPDPGSLLAQIAAHTAEPLWKDPRNWTQAHVDFFCCHFESVDATAAVEAAQEEGDDVAQLSEAVPSPRRSKRTSSIMSLLSNREGNSAARTDVGKGTAAAVAAAAAAAATAGAEKPSSSWSAAANPLGFSLCCSSWGGGDSAPFNRDKIKKLLERGTGLDFHCKCQVLWLLVGGVQRAPLHLNLCVPSEPRPRPSPPRWRSSRSLFTSVFQWSSGRDKTAKASERAAAAKELADASSSASTSSSRAPTPTPTPTTQPRPRVFPAAALVGEDSQAVTLLRALALAHVELGDVEQMRAAMYPYKRFQAKRNRPTAAIARKCLRGVTPAVRLHDPYLLAVIIAMAQGQETWRTQLKPAEDQVLRQNGEGWLCEGGYKVNLIVTDYRDPSGIFVYEATVPPSLLVMLRHPRQAPSTAPSSPACGILSSSDLPSGTFVKDQVVIRYQKVPNRPGADFATRVAEALQGRRRSETPAD